MSVRDAHDQRIFRSRPRPRIIYAPTVRDQQLLVAARATITRSLQILRDNPASTYLGKPREPVVVRKVKEAAG